MRSRLGVHAAVRAALLGLSAAVTLGSSTAVASAQITVTGYPVDSSLVSAPSGGYTEVEPALAAAPDGSDSEWFVAGGRRDKMLAITPSGQQSLVASGLATDAVPPMAFSSVAADGYDWVLDNDQAPGNVLYAVGAADSPSPGLTQVARFGDYSQELTLGPDGALYVADNDGIIRCQITAAPSARCARIALPYPFYTGAGAFAIAGGSTGVWFTDGLGELGAYAPSSGGFGGPFTSSGGPEASVDPGTIVAAPNGELYFAGGPPAWAGNNTEILELSPGDPQDVKVVASGLGNVVAMTIGPDGNVWFLDQSGAGWIGQLNTSTDQVTSYALPSPVYLPQSGWSIASGPFVSPPSPGAGSSGPGGGSTQTSELFFTATTSPNGDGSAEIGVVRGIPVQVLPGALAFASTVKVSAKHRATLTLTCVGQSNAKCAGRIALSVAAKVVRQVEVRSARDGARVRYRTLAQIRHLSLGTISYSVTGGHAVRRTVTLTDAAYSLLEQLAGHAWTATVKSTATVGTVTGDALRMVGPAGRVVERAAALS